MDNMELINYAKQAMKYSYSPYSKFSVGAAVITQDDVVYTGCNIENSSFGATNCAERTAIFKAVSQGERKLEKIAIVSSSNDYTYPCGICLQVMAEFMLDGEIVLYNEKEIKIFKVSDMLPNAFIL